MTEEDSEETKLINSPELTEDETILKQTEISEPLASKFKTKGFANANEILRAVSESDKRVIKERFVLEDVLGHGGMGWVCKARDLRKVEAEDKNPFVAVKFLNSNLEDHPDAFISLQQEAVKSQALAHPNIATVYDFDRDGDTLYMTMELLKGDPLDQLIDHEGAFSKEIAIRYFLEMCAALEYAHRRALVHADFKPANVFVTTSGVVKVLDFGIAQAIKGRRGSANFSDGTIGAFTPAFATSELLDGDPPTESDDVYALACVLYMMLTGKHPYNKKSGGIADQEKIEPARPVILNSSEWSALLAGLSLKRDSRPSSIKELRTLFTAEGRALNSIKYKLAAVALVSGVILVGGTLFLRQDGSGNSDNLFAAHIKEIDACRSLKDISCLEMSIHSASTSATIANFTTDQERTLENRRKVLTDLQTQLDDYISAGAECLKEMLIDCAEKAHEDASRLDAGNPRVLKLYNELQQLRMIRSKIRVWKADAQECLAAKNFECALVKSESILDLIPNHSWALRTKSEAKIAQLEAKRSILIK